MRIELEDYQLAEVMLQSLEVDLGKVFSMVGRSEESIQAERLIAFIKRHGEAPYDSCYRVLHAAFPDARDFEGIVSGAIKAGYIALAQKGIPPAMYLKFTGEGL